MRTIEHDVHSFIAERFCFGKSGSFSDTDSFLEKGILDSTGMVELVSFIESNYELTLADGELIPENLDTVNRVAIFVRRKRAVQQQPTIARSSAPQQAD